MIAPHSFYSCALAVFGFFFAAPALAQSVDSDKDRLPDSVEDANGNGRVDPGETNPFDADSDDDGLGDGAEVLDGLADPDWVRGSDGASYSLQRKRLTWFAARAAARAEGFELASVTTEEQANWLGQTFSGSSSAWIGLSSYTMTLAWSDATPISYLHWAAGQPGVSDFAAYLAGESAAEPGRWYSSHSPSELRASIWKAPAGVERLVFSDPLQWDSDGDGLSDGQEQGVDSIRFFDQDLDGDGNFELLGTDPARFVPDADPRSRTLPFDRDSDDDGFEDGEEDLNLNGARDPSETDAARFDSDGDGLGDGQESGLSRAGPDTSLLIFRPDLEPATQSNPLLKDSDLGGVPDGVEDANHNGRFDPSETDPLTPDEAPAVYLSNLVPSSRAHAEVYGAQPGAQVQLLYSLTGDGPTTLTNGTTVALSPPILQAFPAQTVDAHGRLRVDLARIPAQTIPGQPVWVQLLESSGGTIRAGQGMKYVLGQGPRRTRLVEDFSTDLRLDRQASAPKIWNGNGSLESRLDPASGEHPGGGSGVFGAADLARLDLDTGASGRDAQAYSELLDQDLAVRDGVFMFRSLALRQGQSSRAQGDNPLRVYVRGSADIQGHWDLRGQAGAVNFGMYRPIDERLNYAALGSLEPSDGMKALMSDFAEASGGAGGQGQLAAGSGGHGGHAWDHIPGYYDDSQTGWYTEHTGGGSASRSRYLVGLGDVSALGVHGTNGGRVGGASAQGAPLPAAAAGAILMDQTSGSGMGTWAWPPKANALPLPSEVAAGTWHTTLNALHLAGYEYHKVASVHFFRNFSIARARGGGGGGYWTAGQRGDFHDADFGATDSFGEFLDENPPDFNRYNQTLGTNFNFNGDPQWPGLVTLDQDRADWPGYLAWDDLGGKRVADGAGGRYQPRAGGTPLPFYSLDPVQGFLQGGAGGGGAGNSQHGAFNLNTSSASQVLAWIESARSSDGAGGGAGGSALQLQIAGNLAINGVLDLRGGAGGSSATRELAGYAIDPAGFFTNRAGDAGGGGGSGGALLLQVQGELSIAAESVRLGGGEGGLGAVGNDGGPGGAGVLRIESIKPVSLRQAQGLVLPIESYALQARPEFGLAGANWGLYASTIAGTLGDVSVTRPGGAGNVTFRGNATGVTSDWYPIPGRSAAQVTNFRVSVSWTDGIGARQTEVYSSGQVEPGVTPFWLAVQCSRVLDANGQAPLNNVGRWVIPGWNTLRASFDEVIGELAGARWLRYQLVFDQDLVAAKIGSLPGAGYRVTGIEFEFTSE